MAGPLTAAEIVALKEGDTERCKVSGIAPAIVRDILLSQGKWRVLGNDESIVSPLSISWHNRIGHPRCPDSAEGPHAIEKGREEVCNRCRLLVVCGWQRKIHREYVISDAAEIAGTQ